jgi:hypothetical protein
MRNRRSTYSLVAASVWRYSLDAEAEIKTAWYAHLLAHDWWTNEPAVTSKIHSWVIKHDPLSHLIPGCPLIFFLRRLRAEHRFPLSPSEMEYSLINHVRSQTHALTHAKTLTGTRGLRAPQTPGLTLVLPAVFSDKHIIKNHLLDNFELSIKNSPAVQKQTAGS